MLIESMTIKLLTLVLSAGAFQPPEDHPSRPTPQADRRSDAPIDRESMPKARNRANPTADGPRDNAPGTSRGGPDDHLNQGPDRGFRGPHMDNRPMAPDAGKDGNPRNGQRRNIGKNQRDRGAERTPGQVRRRAQGQRQMDPGQDMHMPRMQSPDHRGPRASGPREMRPMMPPNARGDFQPMIPRGQGMPMGRGQRGYGQRGHQQMPQDFRGGPRFFGPNDHRAPMPPMRDSMPRRRNR